MGKKEIFIHIPKTGGTTINAMLMKSKWQTKLNFNYRHIDLQSKKSNCADIFDLNKQELYRPYKILTMLRQPVDRLLSEYHFLKMRSDFFDLLPTKPTNFDEYCALTETQNYTIKFLLGHRIYSDYKVTEEDFNQVIDRFNSLSVFVGIFEHYSLSLNYFTQKLTIQWPNVIHKKRVTLSRPSIDTITPNKTKVILENNAFDFKLYELFRKKLLEEKCNIPSKIFHYTGNRYNYVEVFVKKYCLLEIDLSYKEFVISNHIFFKCLHELTINCSENGTQYVANWNKLFVEKCVTTCPDSTLALELLKISNLEKLEATTKICNIIDLLASNPSRKKELLVKLTF